ncbi:MAG: hypothetical protein ACRERT_02960, partial [Pseudomonas sp.]
AVTGIVRAHHRGPEAIARLASEILKEMVLSRQGLKGNRLQTLTGNSSNVEPPLYEEGRSG